MALRTKTANEWETMHGIFPVPKGVRSITLKLGQAQRKGTPQNGSAARVKDVEARLFDTRSDAAAYVATYNALYDSVLYRLKRDTVRPIDRADAAALKEKFGLTEDQ